MTGEATDNIRKVSEQKRALHLRVSGRIDKKRLLDILSYKNREKSDKFSQRRTSYP